MIVLSNVVQSSPHPLKREDKRITDYMTFRQAAYNDTTRQRRRKTIAVHTPQAQTVVTVIVTSARR